MKQRSPLPGIIRQTTSRTVERAANIVINILTWRINLTKILSGAYSLFATSPGSTMSRGTSRNVTSRYGGVLYIRFIPCVTTLI